MLVQAATASFAIKFVQICLAHQIVPRSQQPRQNELIRETAGLSHK